MAEELHQQVPVIKEVLKAMDIAIIEAGLEADDLLGTISRTCEKKGPGDWGGLVLLGTAPINVTGGTSQIEAAGTPARSTAAATPIRGFFLNLAFGGVISLSTL